MSDEDNEILLLVSIRPELRETLASHIEGKANEIQRAADLLELYVDEDAPKHVHELLAADKELAEALNQMARKLYDSRYF